MHSRHPRILTDAIVVGALTVLVKLAGAAKVVISAHQFGAGDQFDGFVIAFMIPSFLGEVLAGSLIASLIPAFIHIREAEGETSAHRLYSAVLSAAVVFLTALALATALFSRPLLHIFASRFDAPKLDLTQHLFIAMTPILPLSAISVTWRALLNSREKFAAAAAVPMLTPIVSIALLIASGHQLGAFALAFGATIGTFAEVVALGLALRAHRIPVKPVRPQWSQPARHLATQYLPMAIGSIMLSGSNLIDQTMAAMLPAGSASVLNFGTRVTGVILAVGPTALSTAILPRFSQMAARADWVTLRGAVKHYALLSLALSIPATAICMFLSEPIVRFIYQRGAFHAADTHLVARVQFWSLLVVPGSILLALAVRLVSALKVNQLLLPMAVLSLIANVILDYVLMRRMGVAGIAFSTALVVLLSLVTLSFLLSRRVKTRGFGAY